MHPCGIIGWNVLGDFVGTAPISLCVPPQGLQQRWQVIRRLVLFECVTKFLTVSSIFPRKKSAFSVMWTPLVFSNIAVSSIGLN